MAFVNGNLATITASTNTDLIQAGTGKKVVLYRISACNCGSSSAQIRILITNSSDTVQETLFYGYLLPTAPANTFRVPFNVGLDAGQKIMVWSDSTDVDFGASGYEVASS